jgi:hypothetical protein
LPNNDELRWRDANRGRLGLVLDGGGELLAVVDEPPASGVAAVAAAELASLFGSADGDSVWPVAGASSPPPPLATVTV